MRASCMAYLTVAFVVCGWCHWWWPLLWSFWWSDIDWPCWLCWDVVMPCFVVLMHFISGMCGPAPFRSFGSTLPETADTRTFTGSGCVSFLFFLNRPHCGKPFWFLDIAFVSKMVFEMAGVGQSHPGSLWNTFSKLASHNAFVPSHHLIP